MGVDHGGPHVLVPEQLLHRANVVAVLQEVDREGMAAGVTGGMVGEPRRGGCRFDGPLEEWRIGAMAETESRCARAEIGGHTGLSARLGSEALSLADPMGPPPSVVTGRGDSPKGTPGLLGLSSPMALWRASDAGAGQGRHGVAFCAPGDGTGSPWQQLTTDCPTESSAPGLVCVAQGRVV